VLATLPPFRGRFPLWRQKYVSKENSARFRHRDHLSDTSSLRRRTWTPQPKWQDYVAPFNPRQRQKRRRSRRPISRKNKEERRILEKRFQQHLFAVAVQLGLVALVVARSCAFQLWAPGLMFGGIFSICDGYFNYWSELAPVLKFVSLLIAFILLLFLGYRRLEKKEI